MQTQLNGLGLKAAWVNGVDTREQGEGSGIIECYESHLMAYRRLLESEDESCLVLEDDVVLFPELVGRMALEIDLVFLEERHRNKPVLRIGPFSFDRQICLKRFAATGAAAYAINRRAAERILERHEEVKMQIDVLLHSWWRTGLLTAYVIPPLAEHGQDESMIGTRAKVHHRPGHRIQRRLLYGRQKRRVKMAYRRMALLTTESRNP